MSATEKFFKAIKDVIVLSHEVKGLSDEVRLLDGLLHDVDRRVVRVETILEIAQKQKLLPAD